MPIDVMALRSSLDDIVEINETYSFTEEQLKNTEIIKLDNLKVEGEIHRNHLDDYIINATVTGTMLLPSSPEFDSCRCIIPLTPR